MSLSYTKKGKRQKVDYCNICNNFTSLTWDHVPPKGGINLKSVEQLTLLERLAGKPEEISHTYSQNGVKYRTICKRCNDFLGHTYDPILNGFARGVGRLLKSFLQVPPLIHYKSRPAAITRSILGHLLAAKKHRYESTVDDLIRKYLINPSAPLPDEIKIFYWVYPFNEIIVVRDILMPSTRGNLGKMGFFSGLLMYYPIAYLVCDLECYEGLSELSSFRGLMPDESADIPIDLTAIRSSGWPLTTDEGNIVFGGISLESSIYARPKES